jgi:hypothetical protein
MPVKRRIDKRRCDLPSETITRLLEAQPIEFSEVVREVIIAAVYFRDPALPPEAEARGLKLLATWREQSCV